MLNLTVLRENELGELFDSGGANHKVTGGGPTYEQLVSENRQTNKIASLSIRSFEELQNELFH